jgi:hypothetical protein
VVVSPIQHHLQQTAVSKSVQGQNDREVLKKRFPAHFLREKMNARKKKKGMGAPKGILGQRRRPYPQISATPTFCIFTGIDDFIHYSPHINQQKL